MKRFMERKYSKLYLFLRKYLISMPSFERLIEKLEADSPNPEIGLFFFVGILIVPIVPAIILTLLHVYPATIGFHLMDNWFGGNSLKGAMLLNIALFIIGAFVLALPLLITNRICYEYRKRRQL
ncbi:MAG: hypothetical protein U0V74_17730 [Chitinophagales bacterium]